MRKWRVQATVTEEAEVWALSEEQALERFRIRHFAHMVDRMTRTVTATPCDDEGSEGVEGGDSDDTTNA